jgi:hypothetical protein
MSRVWRCRSGERDAAHAVCALGVSFLHADRVAGARRQHLDIVASRPAVRPSAAGVFRSAENLRPVSVDDESDSHDALNVYASILPFASRTFQPSENLPYALVAREISRVTRMPIASSTSIHSPGLWNAVGRRSTPLRRSSAASGTSPAPCPDGFNVILFNGNFNHSTDVQGLLERVRPEVAGGSRVVVALYNWYFAWLLPAPDRFGMRQGPPISYVPDAIRSRATGTLAGFEWFACGRCVLCPGTSSA